MSEVRLVVREAEQDWSGTMHGSTVDRAIAALSADPVTLAELNAALARYEKPTRSRNFFAGFRADCCDEPYDAGIVLIDLVARLVVVDSTYSLPVPTGGVDYHNGHCATKTVLPYHLADDWLISRDILQWRAVARLRRQERASRPVFDARDVFYGRPLLEFIARETLAAQRRGGTHSESEHDTVKEIHAAWLLTPRDDLGGLCPRDVALAQRDHLVWDLQDQAERWSLLGECPPGLDESSFAYRYGGFGIHELVKYYDLVRELLHSCRERLVQLEQTPPGSGGIEALTVADFLASEIPRLQTVRDDWLNSPDPGCRGHTPRSVIDRERARLPEVMSGKQAIIDPDCPCCQMVGDHPGPVFWHLDGCEMDDEFAFDIQHRTRADWEAERRKWEELSRRLNAEWAERERLGVARTSSGEASVWSSSFCVGDTADVPLGVRLFGIGGHLAELIVGLRGVAAGASAAPEARQFIDQLNRDFGNLREVLQTSEPSLCAALIDPVISRFTESLAAVAASRPDLSAKCESLTNSLAKFLEPETEESTWDEDDLGNPF